MPQKPMEKRVSLKDGKKLLIQVLTMKTKICSQGWMCSQQVWMGMSIV
jgi:hypothetical protein